MAYHDDIPVRRRTNRERWENILEEHFAGWIAGRVSGSALMGTVGVYAGKWGENATTRVITAAYTEWGTWLAEAKAGLGQGAPAGEYVPFGG